MINLGKETFAGKSPPAEVEALCDLLLQVGGRDTNRLPSVRRHVAVLEAALPHMTKAQAQVARERINRFETKWGPLLPQSLEVARDAAENCEIAPEVRVAHWLSVRKVPERLLLIARRAAVVIWGGETSLGNIMDHAYAGEIDRVVHTVGLDSFKEMLFQLRIAVSPERAVYRPGSLCQWWVEDMEPSRSERSSYAACLKLVVTMKSKRFCESRCHDLQAK